MRLRKLPCYGPAERKPLGNRMLISCAEAALLYLPMLRTESKKKAACSISSQALARDELGRVLSCSTIINQRSLGPASAQPS